MISKLNKILLFTILLIFTTILSLTFLLFSGIKIQSFDFNNISVKGLYLKIDKKLIVSVDQLHLPKSEENTNSLDDLQVYIQKLPILQKYVKLIDLKQFYHGEDTYIIEYDEKNIYIDGAQFNISLQPSYTNDILKLQLYSLYLKDQGLMFTGDIKYDMGKNNSLFSGKYYYKDLQGSLTSIIDYDFINFHIDSTTIKDIKFIRDFVRLEPQIEEWMYDNVTGEFKFNYLSGKVAINEKGLELIELNGDANVTNAQVKYHKDLEPVHTPLLNIQFKDDNLYFNMEKPLYKGIKLYGSSVTIYSLTGEKPYIDIDLVTQHKLSKEIIEIVEAYGGEIPITQVDGATQSKLKISVKLHGDYNVDLYGEFSANNSNFKIKSFEFFAHKANVILDNNKLLIKNSLVEYDKNLKMNLDLDIDLKQNIAHGLAKNLQYKVENEKYSFLDVEGLETKVKVDFNEELMIDVQALDLQLINRQSYLEAISHSLTKLSPYSKFLEDLGTRWGSGILKIYSKDKIDFGMSLKNLDFPFYKNNQQVTSMNILGSVNNGKFKFTTDDGKLSYSNTTNILTIRDMDLKHQEKKENQKYEKVIIKGIRSDVLLDDDRKILADKFELRLEADFISLFNATYKDTIVNFQGLNKNRNLVDVKNITAEFFEAFSGKKFVYGGISNLHAESHKGQYNGVLYLKNVLIKSDENKQNQTNSKEGQNISEYMINNGKMLFLYDDKTQNLNFYEVTTQGNGLDLEGRVNINLISKNIDGEFDASFFKTASKVIGSIPLINYLILGDEQKISLTAKVSGTLEDIQISTNAAESTVKAPFSIFGRALLLPFKTIEKVVQPNKD